MKLLMTTDCVGGVWNYATTLCRALAAHDVAVTLAVTGGEMSGSQRAEAAALGNVELHHRPYKCEWMREPWKELVEAGHWIDDLAERADVDLFHLNDFRHGDGPIGGRPRLVVAHSDVFSWHQAVTGEPPDLEDWSDYWWFTESGLVGAAAVVAPTEAVMAELDEHYRINLLDDLVPKPRVVIPNAVEPPTDSPAADREPFVLCAGRVWDAAKNVRTLADAAAGLPWPVKVAGDASHPDGGTASFENVDLLGPLPHGELLSLMSRAAVYALPAKYEPFGLSAVEAASRGCALVLGDIPSLREVWGDAAVFVPPDDADALRATLLRLIEDDPERRRLASLACDRAARYTPEAQALQYLQLYRQLLDR